MDHDQPDDTFTLDGPDGLGFAAMPTIALAEHALASGFDTVIGVRPEWVADDGTPTLPLTLEITFGAERFDDTAPALAFAAGADTTIANFEAAIAGSQYLFIVSRSTVTGINFTAGDVIAPTSFGGGAAGGVLA